MSWLFMIVKDPTEKVEYYLPYYSMLLADCRTEEKNLKITVAGVTRNTLPGP